MTTVKKQYEEIYSLLEASKNKKVSTVLPQLIELMSRKNNSSGQANTFLKVNDEVVAIYCYYHKKWELLSECEYGSKKNTATGYNTMCKEGVSKWTKQQRVKKLANEELLTRVASGEVLPEDIAVEQGLIAEQAKEIVPREDGHGTDEAPEVEPTRQQAEDEPGTEPSF